MNRRKILALAAPVTLSVIFILLASPASAQQPSPAATGAFNHYVQSAEAQATADLSTNKSFLYIDALPDQARRRAYTRLKQGQTIVTRSSPCEPRCPVVPGALIHDWVGIVFVPGVTLAQTLATLQDYNRDADYYRPQVVQSKLLSASGNDFHVFLRLKQTYGITVVLDTEYAIHYTTLDLRHVISQSRSTRISEVANSGSPDQYPKSPAEDHGFLWRLNSYWRFYETDGGVYIQCQAISLSRDIPEGLNWLVAPYTNAIPRDSLELTLTATRKALLDKFQVTTKS